MKMMLGVCAATLLASAGAAFGQYDNINGLAEAPYWYADRPNSTLTITNNGLSSIRFEDGPFGSGGFTNRHHAALAVNGTPFQFRTLQSFQFDVDVTISGPGRTEAGIWIGTAPFFPNPSSADIGQFVALPDNSGEIAAFGGVLPFFSNNQAENAGMARADRNETIHLTMIYTAGPNPSINYGVNGVFTGPLDSGATFPGILDFSLLGVYVQGPNGAPEQGNVDVTFSNLSIVPAPGALALLGLGGLAAARRRR